MFATKQTKEDESTSFVEHLAHSLGVEAKAEHVFGAPIERDGVMIIPVANARYGFGGGSGKKTGEEGAGGGGGMVIKPAGYIEVANGNTRYRPIRDIVSLAPAIAATGVLALLAARGLYRIFRA